MIENEMVELCYREESDGLLYPIIVLEQNRIQNLGKFGKAKVNYLYEYKKEEYMLLHIRENALEELERLDERCYEKSEQLQQSYLEQIDLSQLEFMEVVRLRTMIRNIADETIMSQILE